LTFTPDCILGASSKYPTNDAGIKDDGYWGCKTQDALKSSSTLEQKIEAITFIINWFEAKEEYEKCLELKKIIKELEAC
jgi:hypothetical protein